jgi:hypothetical protein
MKRKYLYALALLLALSTVAFSNESTRFRCRSAGKIPCATAATRPTAASPNAAATEEAPNGSDSHVFLHTFIKLLYI